MQAESPTPRSHSSRLALLALAFVALHVGALVAHVWPATPAAAFLAASWTWVLLGASRPAGGKR